MVAHKAACYLLCTLIRQLDAVHAGPDDSWLDKNHLLLLMDDTVIMATSRERLIHKLNLLKEATDLLKMGIHPSKSQFTTV